jgi:hypothetical protein
MAILQPNNSGGDYRSYKIETLAPKGTFPAICIDCMESLKVERKKWESEEMETVDLLRFLFIVDTKEGPSLVQTNEMKITAFKEAALAKFILGWTGDLPSPGFDTMDLVGETCQLTLNHKTSNRGNAYPVITSISPLLDASIAPSPDELEIPGGSRSGIEIKPKPIKKKASRKKVVEEELDEENPF